MGLLIFLAMIITAVILHEGGHYLAARHFGVIADEFNIGIGPKICGRKIGGTDLNLRILPFGGSCVLDDGKMRTLSPRKRIGVFFAGPFVNLTLSCLCFLGAFLLAGNTDLFALIIEWAKNVLTIIPSFFSSFVEAMKPSAPTISESGALMENIIDQQKTSVDVAIYLLKVSCSLNAFLFIGNIIPVPALDGGQIILILPECFHRPLSERKVAMVNWICYIAIMGFSGLFLLKDVLITILRKC